MSRPYIHHGVMFSYYSAKTRAYLSYKRLPFVEQYSGPELAGRIRETTHKVMIPVVETPAGEILQDTTVIIDTLEQRHPERPVLPKDATLMLFTRLVEFCIDELWISTAMHSRWNDPRSRAFIIREFGNGIGSSFGLDGDAALAMGNKVAGQMQSYLPYLGVGDADGQEAVDAFFKQASVALEQLLTHNRFVLGATPSLIDFCVFTGYYAHQYRDPGAAQDFLKTDTPRLCYFLDTLHAAQLAPDQSELSMSPALTDYLAVLGPPSAAFANGLLGGAAAVLERTPEGQPCEGMIPAFSIPLGEHSLVRGGSVFSLWKLQRVREAYLALSADQQNTVADVLADIGWLDVLQTPAPLLERRDHQLYLG